jgi:hypothetical protein
VQQPDAVREHNEIIMAIAADDAVAARNKWSVIGYVHCACLKPVLKMKLIKKVDTNSVEIWWLLF